MSLTLGLKMKVLRSIGGTGNVHNQKISILQSKTRARLKSNNTEIPKNIRKRAKEQARQNERQKQAYVLACLNCNDVGVGKLLVRGGALQARLPFLAHRRVECRLRAQAQARVCPEEHPPTFPSLWEFVESTRPSNECSSIHQGFLHSTRERERPTDHHQRGKELSLDLHALESSRSSNECLQHPARFRALNERERETNMPATHSLDHQRGTELSLD
eukprot:4153898-Amphidinium_carterae.1